MNGHISFSVSMKNIAEIKDAIGVLLNLLPSDEQTISARRWGLAKVKAPLPPMISPEILKELNAVEFNPPVAKGKIITGANPQGIPDFKPKPKMLPNDKIVENLMRGAPKNPPAHKHDGVYRDADGKVKVHKGIDTLLKEKFRQNALKRKRDATGHFLPGKKK